MTSVKYPGITENILDLIGDTPLLRLNKLGAGLPGSVLVKLEYLSLSGSIKDRMAVRMIEQAEEVGCIQPGRNVLVEASSGNTAQAVALVGAVKGYTVKIRLPEATAVPEKLRALQRYGAEVELMKSGEGAEEADALAKAAGLHGATIEIPGRVKCRNEEAADKSVLWLRQFSNPANTAGQAAIAEELLAQTGGKVDVFINSIGTGGTFLGVARVLKAANPNCRCIALEPAGVPGAPQHLSPNAKYIPGITGGIIEEIRDSGLADEVISVPSDDAVVTAYQLSKVEGINCGISTGANVRVALEFAARPEMKGKNIVTIAVDNGHRYVSLERYTT